MVSWLVGGKMHIKNSVRGSGEMTLPISVSELLPHEIPILMVEDIISYDDASKSSTIKACVDINSPFINDAGQIENECLLEIIAQAAAAQHGFNLIRKKSPLEKGFLAGVNYMKIYSTANVGDSLMVNVECGTEISSLSVVNGKIFHNKNLIAEAAITVWHG